MSLGASAERILVDFNWTVELRLPSDASVDCISPIVVVHLKFADATVETAEFTKTEFEEFRSKLSIQGQEVKA